MKKEAGNVGDFMEICICMLLLTALMVFYLDNVRLVDEKAEINQIARKYILRMETVGQLTERDRFLLCRELEEAGATALSLAGTTLEKAEYGEPIILEIKGKLRGIYEFKEKRVSVAKY